MSINDLIRLLETMPESMRDMEVHLFSTDDGRTYRIRTDVSQGNINRGALKLYGQEVVR